MSHTSVFKAGVKDIATLRSIVEQLGGSVRETNKVELYNRLPSDTKITHGIKLPLWHYEIGVTADGELVYDNFQSQRGSMEQMGKMLQDYNVAVTTQAASMQQTMGSDLMFWTEQQANGDMVVVIDYE